ncbi:hypothetical protein ACHAW6_010764 [Cyclotella cf. meneghiniana]
MDPTTVYIIAGSVAGFVLILLCACCCLGLCGFSVAYRKKANERARAAAAAARRKRAKKKKEGEAASVTAAQQQQQQQSLQMVPYLHQASPQQSVYAIPPPIIYPQPYPTSHTVIYPPQPSGYYPQGNHTGSYPQDMSGHGQGQPYIYPTALSHSIAPPMLPRSITHAADLSHNNSSEASLTAELASSINRLTKYLERETDDTQREPDNTEQLYAQRRSAPNNVYINNNRSSSHSVLTKPSMLDCANGDALLEPCDDIGGSDLTQDIEGGEANQQTYESNTQTDTDAISKTSENEPARGQTSIEKDNASSHTNAKQFGDQRSVVTAATLKSFSVVIGQLGEQEIIDVTTSPGVLGIVLDAADEGWPIIRKIKMDSVLQDQVSVGDRVMTIDGKDARNMTIGEVSGLLNKFSDESRMVTVLRKESKTADV